METSEQINELVAAMAAAQGEFTNIQENQVNPFYNSRYADLAAILEGTRKILSANKLAVMQVVETMGESVIITTRLAHSSGQWIQGSVSLPQPASGGRGSQVQALAGVITYMRRYALTAILGLATEDTDWNNVPSGATQTQNGNKGAATEKLSRPLTPLQLKNILTRKAAKYDEMEKACSPKQRQFCAAMMGRLYDGDVDKRHEALDYLTGFDSTNNLTPGMVLALLDWMEPIQDSGGEYILNADSCREAAAVWDELQKAHSVVDALLDDDK